MAQNVLPCESNDYIGAMPIVPEAYMNLKNRHSHPNFVLSTTSGLASDVFSVQQQQQQVHIGLQRKREYMQNHQHELRRLQRRRKILRMQREIQQEEDLIALGIYPDDFLEQEMLLMGDGSVHPDENILLNDDVGIVHDEDMLVEKLLTQEQMNRSLEGIGIGDDQSLGLAYDDDDDAIGEDKYLGVLSADYVRQLHLDRSLQHESSQDIKEQHLQQMYFSRRQEQQNFNCSSSNHDDDLIANVGSIAAHAGGPTTSVPSNTIVRDTIIDFSNNSVFDIRSDSTLV
jgi:hypothetical protein